MCGKCGNDKCSCSKGVNVNDFLQLQAAVAIMANQTKWLSGHPIIALDEPTDIVKFDFTSGVGSGIWLGWSICNGTSYPSPTGLIDTPDLRDRFLTGAYGSYVLGQTGGENTHILTEPEMPLHNHALTDPGHTHAIIDPGHTHPLLDPGHTHIAVPVAHQHSFTTNSDGAHTHSFVYQYPNNIALGGITVGPLGITMIKGGAAPPISVALSDTVSHDQSNNTVSAGAHTHTGTTDATTETVNITSQVTGATVENESTFITNAVNVTSITLADTGGSLEHENRPPFYAVLFVKKIF